MSDVSSAPAWFTGYTGLPVDHHRVVAEGAGIHYQKWLPQGATGTESGLIFVHGNGAHAHWWDFIAPAFAGHYEVAALDLSGAGDSDHRQQYSAVTFAREILAVGEDAGFHRPILVAHSFGGSMSRIAGYLRGDRLGGIVLVDSAISRSVGRRRPPGLPRQGTRYYDSMAEAVRRFRLRPPQPCDNRFILDYIARHSVKETERGFCYKLDQSLFAKMTADPGRDFPDGVTMLQQTSCPMALVYGTRSRFFPHVQVELAEELFPPGLIASIEGAHHHVFLDQPLKFIDTLATILHRIQQQDRL